MDKTGIKICFSLENITVISPMHPLKNNLNKVMKTGPQDIDGIRLSRKGIGSSYIEDAYIYRIQ
jgi:hypothetical protein